MIERQLIDWLKKVFARPQIVHILGLRQTGKTTLLNEFRRIIPNHLHYPLQNYTILNKYRSNIEEWILEIEEALSRTNNNSVLHVFIDEIQKIPDLFQALQGLYDNYKGRIKFWIWGSSARPLKRRRAETLSGRVISRIMFPLSQNEIRKNDSLTAQLLNLPKVLKNISYSIPPDYITFLKKCFGQSLLPEPFLTRDKDAVYDLLDTYKASYLENEIRRENLVSDIGIFSRFLTIAAAEDSEVLNYNSVAKDLGISSHTVKTYHGILEDTFVTSQLNPYTNRMRMQVCKSSKVYFTDTGLARFVSGQSNPPVMQTSAFGKCFEGFVINEIIKQVEYQSLRWKLSFFRTKNGREADLIISDGQKKCAIEIKAKKKITTSDFKNLKYMMENDISIAYGIVISLQGAPIKLAENIYNFPAWNL